MEVEDDLFFADLSKQISLLLMDGEDDHDDTHPPVHHFDPLQDLYYVARQQHVHQHQQQHPRLVQELQKNHQGTREISSKGTGVFIPRFAQMRRKRGINHHHSAIHGSLVSDNYSRPKRHDWLQQQQLHDYGTRRLYQEDSKAKYFH